MAADALEKAGWVLNGEGIRSRKTEGTETELRLRLGMPENPEAKAVLEQYLAEPLRGIGIALDIQTLPMEEIGKAYRGETGGVDLAEMDKQTLLHKLEDLEMQFNKRRPNGVLPY